MNYIANFKFCSAVLMYCSTVYTVCNKKTVNHLFVNRFVYYKLFIPKLSIFLDSFGNYGNRT